jgi:hypothetical protein
VNDIDIIPLKMILITWLKVHNTEKDFLMFKYMINIILYSSFRITWVTSHINPRPISSLELKLSGWYGKSHIIFSIYVVSPRNENFNLLLRIKFLNLFLYGSILNKNWEIYWSEQNFAGLGPEDRCSSWGLCQVAVISTCSRSSRLATIHCY